MKQFNIVSAEEAARIAENETYVVVDLRTYDDYLKSHLKGAVSLPDGNLEAIHLLKQKDKKWLIYCSRGNMSFRLASKMIKDGYDVTAVSGNILTVL